MNSMPGSMEESGGLAVKEPFFTRDDVPPVLETNKYWLLNVLRDDLTWLCPVEREGMPTQDLNKKRKKKSYILF
jgi:AP-3 complex subunit mu